MTNLSKFILIIAAVCLAVSCRNTSQANKHPSGGAPFEIIVIASQEQWNSPLGDTIQSIMTAQVPYINNYEPQFDIYRLAPSQLSDMIRRNRNLIVVTVDPQYSEPQMKADYDKYSAPQLIVHLVGPDKQTLTSHINEYAEQLRTIFNLAEYDRYVAFARRSPASRLVRLVKDKFGIDINLLHGFIKGKETDDFLWMRYRYPESDQELMIYSYPYSGQEDFTEQALIERRNQFVSRIPGELPDSHMITVHEVPPQIKHMRINGRYWAELRGFWEVKNDFMGGPFVSYTSVDEETNRVITIDAAVFSPSPYKEKRNLLRQLEAVVYGVKFPVSKRTGESTFSRQAEEQQDLTQQGSIKIEEIIIY